MADVSGLKVSYLKDGVRVYRRLVDLVALPIGNVYKLYAIVVCRYNGCVELVNVTNVDLRIEVSREQPIFD